MGDLYTTGGFWFGVAGAAVGFVGLVWGIWARNHPKTSQLGCRVTQSPLIESADETSDLEVTLGGKVMPDAHLIKFEIVNMGPHDLSPSAFDGGYLRLASPPPQISPEDLRRTLEPLSILGGDLAARIDYPSDEPGVAIVIEPFQLKVGRSATLTIIIAGRPTFSTEHRLTSFDVLEFAGDKPDDYELKIELPVPPFGSIPVTWRPKRHR